VGGFTVVASGFGNNWGGGWGRNNDRLDDDEFFGMVAGGAISQLDGDGGRDGVATVGGDGHESGPAVTDLDAQAAVGDVLDELGFSVELFVYASLGHGVVGPVELNSVAVLVSSERVVPAHLDLVGGLSSRERDGVGSLVLEDGRSIDAGGLASCGDGRAVAGGGGDATLDDGVVLEAIGVAGKFFHGDHAGGRVPGGAISGARVFGPDVGVIGIFEASH